VGLLETVNHWAEQRYGIPRHRSALITVGSISVFSVISLLSYNVLKDVGFGGFNFNAVLEYLYEIILLPVGGLMIAIFAGWFMKKTSSRDELTSLGAVTYEIWHFLIRFVVPPALLVIIVSGITS
jgi:NSS family neurotransmitter:Na+ symporter